MGDGAGVLVIEGPKSHAGVIGGPAGVERGGEGSPGDPAFETIGGEGVFFAEAGQGAGEEVFGFRGDDEEQAGAGAEAGAGVECLVIEGGEVDAAEVDVLPVAGGGLAEPGGWGFAAPVGEDRELEGGVGEGAAEVGAGGESFELVPQMEGDFCGVAGLPAMGKIEHETCS